MKASELRLGNYVSYAETGTQFRVAEIALGGLEVHSDEEMNWIEIEEFEGIPLTEEWLLKFGFRKSNLAGYDQHFQYHHPKLNNPITALYNADFSMNLDGRARVLKHVHQLQNAFFVIAGEELTLTGDPYPKTIDV